MHVKRWKRKEVIKYPGYEILSLIRDTMSDRTATEKKFHQLLEDYRAQILPTVMQNWHDMSIDEQVKVSKIHNFYCALHLLVAFADVTTESIHKFEKLHSSSSSHL